MNCKPNQLARLIGNITATDSHTLDRVIVVKAGKVVKTVSLTGLDQRWIIEEPIPIDIVLPSGLRVRGRILTIRDSYLKPILPPDNELTEIVEEIRKEMNELSHELV